MQTDNFWSQLLVQILGGLIVAALVGIFVYLRSEKFKNWIIRLFHRLKILVLWLLKRWRIILIIFLLFTLEVSLFYFYSDWKIVIFSLIYLTIIILIYSVMVKRPILSRTRNENNLSKFLPIRIPPSVGNKQMDNLYLDYPTGKIILGEVEFLLEPKSLVFDTSSHIRYLSIRDDGCKVINFSLYEPVKSVISVHVLLNSGNSKSFYTSEKIGEINLQFKDAPPITTNLILGKNLREWCVGSSGDLVRKSTDRFTKVVWKGVNNDGTFSVIDCLEIPIQDVIQNNELETIEFVHRPLQRNDDTFGVHFFVSGISLEIDSSRV
jgi:hypothetical protein